MPKTSNKQKKDVTKKVAKHETKLAKKPSKEKGLNTSQMLASKLKVNLIKFFTTNSLNHIWTFTLMFSCSHKDGHYHKAIDEQIL